jgi:outer membrane protein OmpA-like peptidoglycan-associated protein
MHSIPRILVFFVVYSISLSSFAQQQDKEQSKLYMEQADLMMEATRAMDDARDLMVTAANFDTTNIKANFEAGFYHIQTIGKHLAAKYFLRIARQDPDYRFDLEFWIGKSYHYGLEFEKALIYYNKYRDKLIAQPKYLGKDKVELPEVERKIQECINGKEFVANPKKFSIVNMGREINSEFEDYAPVLNESEDEIVFTTRRRDGNLNENVYEDNKPFEDVFYATKVKGKWSRAKNIGSTINTKYNNSNAALSADGKTLYMYNDEGNGDIYVSERLKDGTWGVPAPLPGVINSSFREESITVTKDGKTIYFSSERPGGLGGSDIYSCTKDTIGRWTILKNLGAVINTELDEGDPFIDYDGKTLYFSSKGGKGMGGYDIFKTSFDAEKEEWSVPENLGYPINTPDDDIQFVSTKDGERSYYASVHDDGLGYEDIYIITVPVDEKPAKPTGEFKYLVKVIDADSKTPLAARVKLQGLADNSAVGFSAGGKGESVFTIKETSPKDYKLTVEMEGYIFQNQSVRIEGVSEQPKTISTLVEMRKLKIGAATTLRNLYFDFAKATFKEASYNELNKLENMMKQNAGLRVEISGHTDNIGTSEYNKQLSQRRANAVKDFLTSKGIDARRIKASGYGEDRPIATNDDDVEGREINRRVDFIVLGN